MEHDMQSMRFKRGDTFSLLASVSDEDITGWTIASQIRKADGTLVADLVATITSGPAGEYTLTFGSSTSTWPVGAMACDIQYTTGDGIISSTETFLIQIEEEITR